MPRTDQLDGETDWKLRLAVPCTQHLDSDQELLMLQVTQQHNEKTRSVHLSSGVVDTNQVLLVDADQAQTLYVLGDGGDDTN